MKIKWEKHKKIFSDTMWPPYYIYLECCSLVVPYINPVNQDTGVQTSPAPGPRISTDLGIVGIPMGSNCAPLVADLFLFCYERDFMLSLSDNNQTDIIEAFNSTSRYLDDLILIILILNKW